MSSAAYDLTKLEAEAKNEARKQVANLLQRPDQLEKIDQIRKRNARKKASVEAMLKTAMQSQMDGVRTGLNQLKSALEDVREIKTNLVAVDETYRSIEHLGIKLKKVREENSRHSQLAAAVENLKHIFNVPEVVKKTSELISDGKLLHAHISLTELEMARDDLLFELHKQTTQSPTDKHTVNHYFSEVEKLSEDLGKQLWLILHRTISTVVKEPTIIVTVMRIIEREERMDAIMMKRYDQTGYMPPFRPKRWRKKCFDVLEEAVQTRIEGNQTHDRSHNKMWLVLHLEQTRKIALDDLQIVKSLCEPCFPPDYEIVSKYVEIYHNAISQHLQDVVVQGLEGSNEIVTLLNWVNNYTSAELMGHPSLKIDTTQLTPLLEDHMVSQLENQYLQILRNNVQEWMLNSLSTDMKDWQRPTKPDADDKGYYNTQLPVILFQMMEQNLQVAATVNDRLAISFLEMSIDELVSFSKTYKAELNNFKERHFMDRSQPEFFTDYVIANINNAMTFADYSVKLQAKYKKGDVDETDEFDRFKLVGKAFNTVSESALDYLLEEVFIDLTPHLNDILTKKWMANSDAVDTICITFEDYCQDFVHIKDRYFYSLLTKAQNKIVTEYLKALFSRKLGFRSYEERLPAAEKIITEADQLKDLFNRLVGKMAEDSPFDALPMLAEVLKLRDTSMMSLELGGLLNKYPDIRSDQFMNLLLMRGDLGRAEARELVEETMGTEDVNKPRPAGMFSLLPHT